MDGNDLAYSAHLTCTSTPRASTSMASQASGTAGAQAAKSHHWKAAPKVYKKTFRTDWLRLLHFVDASGVQEAEAVRWLPSLLEDDIFEVYSVSAKRENVSSLQAARNILERVAGVKELTFKDFTARKWKAGEETASAFMGTLQNMGAALAVPEGLMKSQFL